MFCEMIARVQEGSATSWVDFWITEKQHWRPAFACPITVTTFPSTALPVCLAAFPSWG